MSHRWNCPTDYEARHEGERAFDYGRSRGSNPYEDSYWNRDRACPDAAEEWDRGYRRAEIRAEEEREEEAARQRAAMRRAEEQAQEDYYYQQQMEDEVQAQEYYASLQEQAFEEPPSADAVDPIATDTGKPSTRVWAALFVVVPSAEQEP